jgi:hypothetical protein
VLLSREVNVLRVIYIFLRLILELFIWVIRRRFVPNYVRGLSLRHKERGSILIVDQELIALHWFVVLNTAV